MSGRGEVALEGLERARRSSRKAARTSLYRTTMQCSIFSLSLSLRRAVEQESVEREDGDEARPQLLARLLVAAQEG